MNQLQSTLKTNLNQISSENLQPKKSNSSKLDHHYDELGYKCYLKSSLLIKFISLKSNTN